MSLTVAQEATLKTLAVMTKADTNIQDVEVEEVRKIMKKEMGVELTNAEVRVAAHDEFIEDRSIEKYIKAVAKQLTTEDKKLIATCMKHVMISDGAAHQYEIDKYNKIVDVLKLSPADLVLID